MSVFAKSVSDITATDVQALLDEKAIENLRLEFKRDIPDKDETLKKLSAFANTLGGLMVVGAEAEKDGRIKALPGVDLKPNYKQTVVQYCFEGVSPPLEVEVSDPLAVSEGKVVYVISIRESDLGPHFLNGRKGVYIRTNEFSSRFEAQLANENEFRQLFLRRQLVRERRAELIRRSRERFDTFTKQKYVELTRNEKGIGARLLLSIGPRFPAHQICDHARLLTLLRGIQIPGRGVLFPRSTGGGFISQHESVLALRPSWEFSILETNTWGMLFYATEIEVDRGDEKEIQGMHSYHLVGALLIFLEHAKQVFAGLGYVGAVALDVRLEAIRAVPWIYFQHSAAYSGPSSALDDEVEFSLDSTTEHLKATPHAVLMDLLRYMFYATNWTEAVTPEQLEICVKGGYLYNSWPVPAMLST